MVVRSGEDTTNNDTPRRVRKHVPIVNIAESLCICERDATKQQIANAYSKSTPQQATRIRFGNMVPRNIKKALSYFSAIAFQTGTMHSIPSTKRPTQKYTVLGGKGTFDTGSSSL